MREHNVVAPVVDRKERFNHMKTKNQDYKELKSQYPKTMSKDQFYRVAHISKTTALYLLQNGLVPCSDTGKQTRRYKIKTTDVINYLKDREIHPELYKAKPGWYSGTAGSKKQLGKYIAPRLTENQQYLLVQYLSRIMQPYDDLLTVKQFAKFTGYNATTIVGWCNRNLKHFNIAGRFLIPKITAIEYLASPQLCMLPQKSRKHSAMLKDFLTVNRINA